MNNINKDIGNRISQLRKKQGLTQENLAEIIDITTKHISSVERGIASLSLERMIALSRVFDCSLDYLILGTGSNDGSELLPPSMLSILSSNDDQEKELLLEYLRFYDKLRKRT